MFFYIMGGKLKNILMLVLMSVLFVPVSFAMLNPATVYCKAMGYNFTSSETPEGHLDQCVLPDSSVVDAWSFLRGEIGKEYSYCIQNGYGIKIGSDYEECGAISSNKCSLCVLPDGSEIEVTTLMNLSFREGLCGDFRCVLGENYINCPTDCPSGSVDLYCDGILDGICDEDCIFDKTPYLDSDCREKDKSDSVCGDGVCAESEGPTNCPEDCDKAELPYFWIILLVIICGIGVYLIYRRSKNVKRDSELASAYKLESKIN